MFLDCGGENVHCSVSSFPVILFGAEERKHRRYVDASILILHLSRILYTFAMKPAFLRALWHQCVHAKGEWRTWPSGSKQSMQPGESLLGCLARGAPLSHTDVSLVVPLLSVFCTLFSMALCTLHDEEFLGTLKNIHTEQYAGLGEGYKRREVVRRLEMAGRVDGVEVAGQNRQEAHASMDSILGNTGTGTSADKPGFVQAPVEGTGKREGEERVGSDGERQLEVSGKSMPFTLDQLLPLCQTLCAVCLGLVQLALPVDAFSSAQGISLRSDANTCKTEPIISPLESSMHNTWQLLFSVLFSP